MIKWIRETLRRWLFADVLSPVTSIEVYTPKGIQRLAVLGAIGVMLRCTDGHSEQLVSEGQAVSAGDFGRAYQQHAPSMANAVWASDGQPVASKTANGPQP